MALLFGCTPGNVSNQRYFRKPAVAGVTPNPAPHKQTRCHGSSSPRASVPPRTLACPWELLPAHVSRGSCVRKQRGRISPDDPERRSRMGLIRLAQCDEQEMTSSSCDRISLSEVNALIWDQMASWSVTTLKNKYALKWLMLYNIMG